MEADSSKTPAKMETEKIAVRFASVLVFVRLKLKKIENENFLVFTNRPFCLVCMDCGERTELLCVQ